MPTIVYYPWHELTWLDDLAEASRSAFWSKPGRLKPGEVPRPWPWPAEPSETNLNKGANTMTHPLDNAIEEIRAFFDGEVPGGPFERGNQNRIAGILVSVYNISRRKGKTPSLIYLATRCWHWLYDLDIQHPWQDMREEYDRAKAKHGDMTLDSDKPTDEQRFYAVVEEVGEVARALTYDREHAGELTNEITQLGALALAWLARELEKEKSQ